MKSTKIQLQIITKINASKAVSTKGQTDRLAKLSFLVQINKSQSKQMEILEKNQLKTFER